jgi:hypothetical protein
MLLPGLKAEILSNYISNKYRNPRKPRGWEEEGFEYDIQSLYRQCRMRLP